MLGYEKEKLSIDQISNMKKVMEEEPELFVKYGIRDSEICLRYSVVMIYQYHDLTGRFPSPINPNFNRSRSVIKELSR